MSKAKSKQKIEWRKATFLLEATDAKEVILMGDFNNWNPKTHPMPAYNSQHPYGE